jgi:hypothetical protein
LVSVSPFLILTVNYIDISQGKKFEGLGVKACATIIIFATFRLH